MMCLIVKSKKGFESAKLKHKLFTFDKTDINNFKFPEFMDSIKDEQLHTVVMKIVEKYKNKNYQELYREELEDRKDWVDIEFLFLLKFYQHGWSIEIPKEEDFFPFWVFTYNLEPLKKQVDKIIGHAYDKLEPNTTKWWLKTATTFSALDVTYLLHYFVMIKPDESEEIEEETVVEDL